MRHEWPAFAAALERRLGAFVLRETTGPGDAAQFALELSRSGVDLVVAAGGDGTVSEVADGILRAREEGHEGAGLAVAPCGTGSDFAAAFAIPRSAEACAARIAEGTWRQIDAGRVRFSDDSGQTVVRHFVSIASLGVSGAIDRVINEANAKRRAALSGKALFYLFTLRELMRYRFQDVRIEVDGQPPVEARVALVAVANNRSFGGGMMIAPDAMDDGMLEVVVVRGDSRLRLMADLRLVYTGAHKGRDTCLFMRGRRIAVTPLGENGRNAALLDIDGESPGCIPATFEVLPGALKVRV